MIKTDKLKHPCFKQPNDENIKVWRYLDTSKFIDLLVRKSLYFSRLDCFEDKHEGTYPEKNILIRNLQLKEWGIKRTYPSHEEFTIENINRTYVNCWYLDNIESEAMWKLYCKNNKGVAIQTTYKKLVESINFDDELFIGKINYIDYEEDYFPIDNYFYPLMHKRKSFEYEKEVRIVKQVSFRDFKSEEMGKSFPWNLENTIENVYVNPYSQNWYYELIKELLDKYNYNINLKWSKMKIGPRY